MIIRKKNLHNPCIAEIGNNIIQYQYANPYNIPANFKAAQLVIADVNGAVVKQLAIQTAGKGTININAANLSSGIYTYSLLVDGKTIESKKMIVEK